MSITILNGQMPIHIWTPEDELEAEARKQLENVATLPWIFHHVAVMADVHAGKGCTVGSVIATKDSISPSMVGVDIGCGMAAIMTDLKASDLPESLKDIRHQIERDIPSGFNQHDTYRIFRSNIIHDDAERLWGSFNNLDEKVHSLREKAAKQLGTLGGGNHFIELCLDTDNRVWMMLHSGSRNIGKCLAEIHINKAKSLSHNFDIADPDLASFISGTPQMDRYRHDLMWAQDYAMMNRTVMLELYKNVLKRFFPNIKFTRPILCHHNYVAEEFHYGEEVFVTRKGAINAEEGKLGIIPGSMGTKSYIVRGLGNPESFNSASHGAGRRMSRGQARRTFTREDLIAQTAGVECRKDNDVIDEIPASYKDIDKVMENQKDLVEIVHELKQILCVKGN